MDTSSNADAAHVTIGGKQYRRVLQTEGGGAVPPFGSFDIKVTHEFDDESGRYLTRSFTVEARDGAEVTGEVLRGLRVDEILRNNFRGYNGKRDEWADDLTALASAGPTDETLRAVARVYEHGVAFRDSPTDRVAAAFGVPRSTAGRWVTRARDRGYLKRTDQRAPHSGSRFGRSDG